MESPPRPPSTAPSEAASDIAAARDGTPSRASVLVGLVAAQVLFGCFHVVGKATLAEVPPLALAGLRVLIATPLLCWMAWRHDRLVPARSEWPMLFLLGLLGVFANQLIFLLGLQKTTAINASIMMNSVPVFAVATAAILGIEKLGARRVAGSFLAVVGALVMVHAGRLSGGTALIGNLFILTNSLCYALFLVLQRPVLQRIPWRTLIAWTFLLGGAPVLPVALPALLRLHPSTLSWGAIGGVLYVALGATVAAYALSTWAVRQSSPSLVAAATTLQPVVAVGLAIAVLHERPGITEAVGFALIGAGLYLVSGGARGANAAEPKNTR